MEHGVGRYAFIGLRDVRGEARYSAKGEEIVLDLFKDPDRHGQTKLKTVEKLTDEFMGYLRSIKEPAKVSQLNSIFSSLLADSAFGPLLNKSLTECEDSDIKPAFLLCSTGHKIAALVVAGLIAKLVPSSLVLFDEPETHLHPPLLAALMNAIRAILHNDESFCVIATHSPVVVQESMAEDVKVIKREGSITSVSGLTSETFGESIGLITAEVFGLNAETTDYHRVLDKLVSKYSKQEELEALFLNGQMSHQARGYTMSRRLLLKKGK
ncbi:ATPase AAA [Pseudomonas amygdali pv. tabaci str. ATCC 11528]|nr:ATPase AAA [Pseudomonas amygdali pv. tabaci str. ATCC 11528]KKY52975.1 ATPase AAA [Pseudomonas amygdali pv. tabaci str. ATCC 11528]QED85976.1 AAA family ATPase [Pseudomonas amygdali pv. tabaci str. ATCC 11528]